MLKRQEPLRRRYADAPSEAWIRDRARTTGGAGFDPFHGAVIAGDGDDAWPIGIHRAVGGFHDLPNPGDLLCAALAGCFETTLRIIAARLGVAVEVVDVEVTGELDVRGTLAVDREVPVGMQTMHCRLRLELSRGVPEDAKRRLVAATERACVVMQTLRHGVPVVIDAGDPGTSQSA